MPDTLAFLLKKTRAAVVYLYYRILSLFFISESSSNRLTLDQQRLEIDNTTDPTMAAPYPQVVLFGDSLWEGCCEAQGEFSFYGSLQKHCNRRLDLVNRGFSGYNTSQALKILEEVFPERTSTSPKLEYLVVLLGANDAAHHMPKENQGLPLDEYKENLKAIITHRNIIAHKPKKIILITPPPLDEIRITELDIKNGHGRAMRTQARSASYSEGARQVVADIGDSVGRGKDAIPLVLVDLHKALTERAISETRDWNSTQPPLGSIEGGKRGFLEKLLPDGLHMSAEAYKVLFALVVPHIALSIPNPNDDGFVYPDWRTAPWLKN